MTTSTQQMTQSSYPSAPEAGVAGMQATTDPALIRTAANLARKAYLVAIATVANTQLYRLVVKFLSRASATWGQEQTVNVDYTSDGSATASEIASTLVTNLNAASVPCTAQALHADGPIQVFGDTPAQDFTLTTANAYLEDPVVDSAEIPFGVMVCKDQSDNDCRLPFTESDVTSGILGLAVRNMAQQNLASGAAAYPIGEPVSYAKKGVFWARVDQAVSVGDDAFVRFTPNGSNAQRGILRKDRDGTAKVVKFAPAEANNAPFVVTVKQYTYEYLSDGSGSDSEIIAALMALVNADTSRHGVVATDGTTTLDLTASNAGDDFDYSASANMVASVTTANVIRAAPINAKFRSAASAGGVAKLELDIGLSDWVLRHLL